MAVPYWLFPLLLLCCAGLLLEARPEINGRYERSQDITAHGRPVYEKITQSTATSVFMLLFYEKILRAIRAVRKR